MNQKRFHSLFMHVLVATTALSLTACLGQKQPDRYNYVAGGKRAPLLNPGGAQYVPPQEGALEEAAAEAFMNRNAPPPPYDAPRQVVPQPELNTEVSAQSGELEPSPLYYYEQQNASVASTPLAQDSMPASQQQPMPEAASDTLEVSAYSVEQNPSANANANTVNTTLEPSPLAVVEQPAVTTTASQDSSLFPALNNVPERNQEFREDYARVQENAANFSAEYEKENAQTEYVTVDEFEQSNPTTPPAEIANTANPSAPVSGTQLVEDQPVLPTTQPAAGQPEAVTQSDMGAYAYQPPQVPDNTYYQQQPIDYTQQPLPVNTQAEPQINTQTADVPPVTSSPNTAQVTTTQTYPASPEDVMIGYDESTVEDVVRAASPEQSVSLAQPVAQPATTPVEVTDAPVVAAAPYSQQLYTDSGPITLRAPQSLAEQRRGRLPESRYSELRRRYSRY